MAAMDAKVIRPVGYTGCFNTSRHSLGLCRCVVFTARYVSPKSFLKSDTLKPVVENAVVTVINQHPMLRVGIAGEDTTKPVYVDLESIDLRQVIEWRELDLSDDEEYTNDILRSIESQHDKLWEDLVHRPGWKIIVHHKSGCNDLDISFAFHHAIGDGQSALIFHRDFFRALNGVATATADMEGHILHFSSPTVLSGPMESIIPFTMSWTYFLKVILSELWKKFAPSWLSPEPSTIPWTGERITLDPYKTNIRFFHIPPETVSSLLSGCREHGTTLTPLFHALTVASLSSRLPVTTFQTSTPISLRQFTNESEFDRKNTIHCLVTEHEYVFYAHLISQLRDSMIPQASNSKNSAESESLIWQLAVEFGKSLKAKVVSLPHDDQLSLLRYISDWKQFWTDKIGEKRKYSWSCSNPGSLKASDVDVGGCLEGWKMKRMIFTQGALPTGSAFEINVAGVENEGLSVTISWQEMVVETSLVECVVEDLRSWIGGFGKNGTLSLSVG